MARVFSVAVLVMALLVVIAMPVLAQEVAYPPEPPVPPQEEVLPQPPVDEEVLPIVVERPVAKAPTLAVTGDDSALLVALGTGLLLTGGGLVYASRRRRLALAA